MGTMKGIWVFVFCSRYEILELVCMLIKII